MIRQLNDDEVRALHYELLMKDIITAAEKLPPFPDVVWKVMSLLRRTAPISEIEAVIKYDPMITSRIIALSQSVYYGRRYDVGSLRDAILVLGDQKLMQVLMTACALRYFQGEKSGRASSERKLWKHSVATAIMSELVARRLKHSKVLTIYTAGLLHDIGKIVLDLYARIYLGASLRQIEERDTQSIAAERRALGIDHQELGEKIARRWRFPQDVTAAIGRHHSPKPDASKEDVATAIYVADRIVRTLEEDSAGTEPFDPEKDAAFVKLGITPRIIEGLQANLSEALSGVGQLLSTA
jgi:putative nucleotidyltransferase with HDIG domain